MRLIAALAFIGAAACAQAGEFVAPDGTFAVALESLEARRFQAVIKQTHDYSCGAAAAATLLTRHYAMPTSEREAVASMLARGEPEKIVREGFSMLDIKRLLLSRGLQAEGYRLSLEQLAALGVPAIALIQEYGYHHFVVVQGLRGSRVLLGDPAIGLRAVDRARFRVMATEVFLLVRNRAEVARATFNDARAWAATPAAPTHAASAGESVAASLLSLRGRSEF